MNHTSVDIKTYNKEYHAFHDAKQRCQNKKHRRFADWGGRGISVLFSSFADFFSELGPCPTGFTLDRINNDKHYEKGNVKWSSRSQQQHNKRRSRHNTSGISGVRLVHAKGLITTTYQAHMNINNVFYQLYTGPDFFEACCARKSKENEISKT